MKSTAALTSHTLTAFSVTFTTQNQPSQLPALLFSLQIMRTDLQQNRVLLNEHKSLQDDLRRHATKKQTIILRKQQRAKRTGAVLIDY